MLRCFRLKRGQPILSRIHKVCAGNCRKLFWNNIDGIQTFYPILVVKQPTVRLRRARRRDASNIIRILRKSFSASEPLVNALQMGRERYSPALEELWQNSISQGMTFLAVPSRIGNNSIFGVVINTTVCPWDPELLISFSSCILCPKTKDLVNLWAFCLQESNIFNRYNQNRIFNIAHVVIDARQSKRYHPDLTPQNLASHLVKKSVKFAYKNGYDLACMICSGDLMASVAENVGMDLFWKQPYKELLNEKLEPIFKNSKRSGEIKVFIQELKGADDKNSEIIKTAT